MVLQLVALAAAASVGASELELDGISLPQVVVLPAAGFLPPNLARGRVDVTAIVRSEKLRVQLSFAASDGEELRPGVYVDSIGTFAIAALRRDALGRPTRVSASFALFGPGARAVRGRLEFASETDPLVGSDVAADPPGSVRPGRVDVALAKLGLGNEFDFEPEASPEEARSLVTGSLAPVEAAARPLAASEVPPGAPEPPAAARGSTVPARDPRPLAEASPEAAPAQAPSPRAVTPPEVAAPEAPAAIPRAPTPAVERRPARRSFMFARVDDAPPARQVGTLQSAGLALDLAARPPVAEARVTLAVEPVRVPSSGWGEDLEVVAVRASGSAARAAEPAPAPARTPLDATPPSSHWIEMLDAALRAWASWLRAFWPW